MRGVTRCASLVVMLGLAGVPAEGQILVANARQDQAALGGGLAAAVTAAAADSAEPRWIAWQAPAAGRFDGCCWDDSSRGCRLEPVPAGAKGQATPALPAAPVMLEGDRTLTLLVRLAHGAVERIRTVAASCGLDAGGLRFTTVAAVPPAQSVAWLRTLVDPSVAGDADKGRRRLRDGALHAIGRHDDPSAVPALLEYARRHADPHIRGVALVALAQTAGRALAPEIAEVAKTDPDVEVKKRAVFALSQLPRDEGVPRLIEIARNHALVPVRRQAMFWLGQSKDPRAVEFFAAILRK